MIYQLRIYTDHPGRVGAHVERFRDYTCRLLEKHGAKVVGCWTTANDENADKVVFMIAHETAEALRSSERAFAADPEQNAMVAASEADGPIIADRYVLLLQPTDFSPLQ